MQKLISINPSNYQVLVEIEISSAVDIAEKVKLAKKAQAGWRDIGLVKKS